MGTVDVEISIRPKRRHRSNNEPGPPPTQSISRLARLMALAIKFQGMVDGGEVRDYADLARLGYVSRARLTQIMNMLLLAPDLQEALLYSSENLVPEHRLRTVIQEVSWPIQRKIFKDLVQDSVTGDLMDGRRSGATGPLRFRI